MLPDRPQVPPVAETRYPIRIGERSAPLLRLFFGVRPERAWVALRDTEILVRFGRFEFRVPLESVIRWRIEGPWRWITAVGIRRSLRHGDITFAGSPHGGVRLDFQTPVSWFVFRVPAIYVAVDDPEAFARAVDALGIPGEDARRP